MIMDWNKKGGIELSLNLIIMLIIGLTVLGLVIGFVTNLIGQAEDNFTGLSETDELERKKVLDMPGIFAAGPSKFNIKSGGKKPVFIKIYNPTNDQLDIAAVVSSNLVGSTIGDDAGLEFSVTSVDLDVTNGCEVSIVTAPVSIQAKDTQAVTAQVISSKSCNAGESFFLSVQFKPVSPGDVIKTETLSGVIVP